MRRKLFPVLLTWLLGFALPAWANLVFPVAPEAYQNLTYTQDGETKNVGLGEWKNFAGSGNHNFGISYGAGLKEYGRRVIHEAVGSNTISDLFALDLNLNVPVHDSDNGLPVRPVTEGVVVWSDNNDLGVTSGYGYVIVRHGIVKNYAQNSLQAL